MTQEDNWELDRDGFLTPKINKGRKFDGGKMRWDLLPYDAVEKIVDILTYGAEKYDPNNWQPSDWS